MTNETLTNLAYGSSTFAMIGSYLATMAASAYDGYMTAKTGEISCARTLLGNCVSIGLGDLSERLTNLDQINTFKSDMPLLGIASAVAIPSALCYAGGLLAGKLDGGN